MAGYLIQRCRVPSLTAARQRGVALLVSLVLLLALSMLAISAMQGTIMQERMSVNQRDLAQAFNAAETALRAGEAALQANPLNFLGNAALPNPMVWNPEMPVGHDPADPNWGGNVIAVLGVAADPARNPVYHIAEAGVICPEGGESSAACDELYVVTARGLGGQANSATVLQSTIVIRP
ncbi:PilX N-terminal domain-containing pilus assembly protein [Salinispirillum marinum]|uniref:PilX N-terminal domain-containing pilus assembly protein n=2 Tax=Saccharospirillaceae TaxID=255527 RepID=A0ABV8BK09_9GAMM